MTTEPESEVSTVEPKVEEVDPNYFWLPEGTIVFQSSDGRSISAAKLAAILMRLGNQQPHLKVEYWIKIIQ